MNNIKVSSINTTMYSNNNNIEKLMCSPSFQGARDIFVKPENTKKGFSVIAAILTFLGINKCTNKSETEEKVDKKDVIEEKTIETIRETDSPTYQWHGRNPENFASEVYSIVAEYGTRGRITNVLVVGGGRDSYVELTYANGNQEWVDLDR